MDVAIGLPNAVPGTTGEQLTEWARRAEARGFSSLGTIDRIAYPNIEPLTALAAAGAVTERIGLGGRDDDYELAEVETGTRGKDLDEMLERIWEVWKGDEMGPDTASHPRVLVGGSVEASFKRAARFGDGWIAAGAPPQQFVEWRAGFEKAWSESGRGEAPQNAALAYFSLGDRAEEDAKAYLTHYYAWLGEDVANFTAHPAAKDAEAVQGAIAAFADAGCQELFLFPSSSDPAQVDLLADAAGL